MCQGRSVACNTGYGVDVENGKIMMRARRGATLISREGDINESVNDVGPTSVSGTRGCVR